MAGSTLPGELIRKRVPGFWPESEWSHVIETVHAASAADRYAGIWWAIENGLTTEVTDEIRASSSRPGARGDRPIGGRALERLAQPCPDPDFSRFRKASLIETQVARGPHVMLLHQHSDAEAEERLAVLERVIRGYTYFSPPRGSNCQAPVKSWCRPGSPMKTTTRAFLHSEKAEVFATTRGYYHPTWNAVVAYDARSTDQQKKPRDTLAFKRDELRRYGEVDRKCAPARTGSK